MVTILKDRVLTFGKKERSKVEFSPLAIPTYHRKVSKTSNFFKSGDKAPHDMRHNCYTCDRYIGCMDSSKGFNYRCTKFKEAVIEETSLDELFKNSDDEVNIVTENELRNYDASSEESILDMISKVIDSNIPVPPDLRISDDEIPLAKNFYQWLTDDKFAKAGLPPFPRQMELGLRLYSEYCPRCSDVEWFDSMPVDSPIPEIRSKVKPLVFGICPKCKASKSEMITSGELPNYYGVIGLAGQRCVVANTMVMTTHGMKYISEIIHPSYKTGFNDFVHNTTPRKGKYTVLNVGLENGHTAKPSDFYISEKSKTYKVTTREGYMVEGTADHPIMTERGWVALKEITAEDHILIQGGQNIWSDVDWVDYDTAMLMGKNFTHEIPEVIRTSGKQIVSGYLKGLFESTGSQVSKGIQALCYILSKKLAKEVQILLLNFGIVTKRYKFGSNLWKVEIFGEKSIQIFKNPHFVGLDTRCRYFSPVKRLKLSEKEKVTYDFEIPGAHRFMANGILNHNSSKTTTAILLSQYNLHKMLKLPSPQSVFGTLATQVITYTYAATTFQQAVENVWNPYLNGLKDTPWFNNYHAFLDRRGNELGEELFNIGEHMVRYRHRNLLMSPSGPNKMTMRGRTRGEGLIDEAGWFPMAKASGKSGEEMVRLDVRGVFTALNNSLLTLKAAHRARLDEGYNDLPKPVMYAISSPSQYNDFIMSSYRQYQNSTEFYAFKRTTWDFNPLLKKRDFKEEFRTKPVEAARDYECNPPLGENLFITEHSSIIKAFRSGPNKIQVITKKGFTKTKSPVTLSEMRVTTNNFPLRGTVLSIDVGIVNNSLSFSIVGIPDDFDEEILPEDRGTLQTPVKVWAIGEVIPKPGTKISLTSVYTECFIPLIEAFNVKYMVSDRWQHAKIAQDLENSYEVIPIEHKAVWSDFEATRDLLYSGNLILPKLTEPFDEIIKTTLDNYPECFRNRPVDHLAWQFSTVREATGVTVLKGDGGTDDTFRTIVLGVAQIQNEEVLEVLTSVNNNVMIKSAAHSVVVKYSGGGNRGGGSGTAPNTTSFVHRLKS